MRILHVNVGRPREVEWDGRSVTTGIFKEPVAGRVSVRRHNLDGDRQADLNVHGGPDKAVYAYAASHYTRWLSELPDLDLTPGAFGENLTIDYFSEDAVRIGDRFQAGTALLAVSQPRLPCFKLNLRHRRDDMIDRMLANRLTGFYLRILEEGMVEAGAPFERVDTDERAITVAVAARLCTGATDDPALLRRAVDTVALPASWRDRFERRLNRPGTTSSPVDV
jgi:MOSC domain-containing protein YiiM